ncbi:MAG: CotH kinase family protein [Flavobacteriales bacterium]|nr:MAG: CotH kinase family protein [Flavobacteriales bacterium]
MTDSYGDGWNGGTLQVTLNGTPVGTFAATGYASSVSFPACTGDTIALFYTPLDWENENAYVLYDEWGGVVFADGPTPAVGAVFTGTADCSVVPAPGHVPCTALSIDTIACATIDNTAAPGTGINPGCANYSGTDVWFTMPVPPSGNVVVSTTDIGGLNDTGIALWVGPNCFNRQLVGCDDDSGPDYMSLLLANELPIGDTLWIQAFGYGGATGPFDLCVVDPGTVQLDSSEIPIVLINTLGQAIPNEPKIDALMEIKYNGPGAITYLTDPANVYDGHIGIEVRGASSSGYPQRPFAVETRDAFGADLNVPLLDMPAESDWVLLSNYNDRSLMRNQVAFHLFDGMGQYAPRTHLCEVLIDSLYRGIYLFGEKIKRDGGRVDIAKLTDIDNAGDELTGGYILQQNYWDNSNSFESNYSPIDHPGFDVHFVYEYPKPDEITPQQRTYIADYVDSLETALYDAGFADATNGYRRYLDTKSFIDYFLVNEVARSNDGFKKSVFWHKDKYSNGGKLKAGPVWDFDWAWKDIASCPIFEATDGSGWAHLINDCFTDNYSCGWYVRMLQDTTFTRELQCAYLDYRTTVLDTANIFHYIDSVAARVQNAQQRHFQKWPILGISGPAPEVNPVATTYAAEIDTLKAWIMRRLDWLDANMPGLCDGTALPEAVYYVPMDVLVDPEARTIRFIGSHTGDGKALLVLHDMLGRDLVRVVLPAGAVDATLHVPASGVYGYSLWNRADRIRSGRCAMP